MFLKWIKKKHKEFIEETVQPLIENIIFLKSMKKLDVKDGDIVVLKHPGVLSETVRKNLQNSIQESIKNFGFNVRVIVFEEGIDIGLLKHKICVLCGQSKHGNMKME